MDDDWGYPHLWKPPHESLQFLKWRMNGFHHRIPGLQASRWYSVVKVLMRSLVVRPWECHETWGAVGLVVVDWGWPNRKIFQVTKLLLFKVQGLPARDFYKCEPPLTM